ncbi:integral membrane G protein-coupled receptor isoform 2 [Schistosoma japonicum]|uniref:Integral membrane G protein-coupled receptor isoform 2 n=1 Tax=Schistosoma japonicum TaxID=6182 RepID=A0A4Z2DVJ2_SCHJA|nr:integral membrane G protein-coupled receptor isoform 2 [Schistosoma japonicum]
MSKIHISILAVVLVVDAVNTLHLKGKWNPSNRYLFLTKFGFQRTQIDELEATRGYIYGTMMLENVTTSTQNLTDIATLVLVDSEFIVDLYGNATEPIWIHNITGMTYQESLWFIETERCNKMFGKINSLAWHKTCSPTGEMDLIRSVPCPASGFCAEEDDPESVVPNSQFTFVVQDLRQPRYWYLSLVACKRNLTTCKWETTAIPRHMNTSSSLSPYSTLTITYDIWLVNGEPKLQSFNQFEHHFSFETHGIAQMFFLFLSLYIILNITAHVKLANHFSLHVCLYLVHLWLASMGTMLAAVHWGVFSFDGRGLGLLSELGTVVTQWADSVFLAVLMCTCQMGFSPQFLSTSYQSCGISKPLRPLTSKIFSTLPTELLRLGTFSHKLYSYYPIREKNICTRSSVNQEKSTSFWPYVILLVTLLLGVKTLLYIWAMFDRDPVIDFSVWNTVPGCLLLALRICLVFWILAVIGRRHFIAQICSESYNLDLCIFGPNINTVHFAAGYLLWIIILPLVVFIGETSVSPLWRMKTILSICFSTDYVAAVVYACLLYRSNSLLDENIIGRPS